MNSQNDKEGSPHIRAAVIAGIFAVVASCIGGIFLVVVAFINNGFIFAGAGNQNPPSYQPTAEIAPQVQPVNTAALSRCELIAQNFPQSSDAIASKFDIPTNTIFDVLHENCGSSIIDGFIYRSNQEVELTVPDGGCIDAPPDSYFSDTTGSNGVGGSRAFSGTVRASAITYRMWCYK